MAEHQWTEAFLDRMMHTGDELADTTIKAIIDRYEVERVNKLLEDYIQTGVFAKNSDYDPEVRKKLQHYFTESGKLPSWTDMEKVREGERLFENYGLIAFSLLGCLSLPELYTCGVGGTQVLASTLQLEKHVSRRIYETAQMIIDVMSEGGLNAEKVKKDPEKYGRGIRAAQRVRLMHAAVRHLLLCEPKFETVDPPGSISDSFYRYRWNKKEWGIPIGQEYMGCTLLTFSYLILRGLQDFGVQLSEGQIDSYIHCWNVVGHIMGVHEEFLDNIHTMDNARVLYDRVMARKRSKTPKEASDGIQLTSALLDFMEQRIKQQVPLGKFLPFQYVPKYLTVKLIGAKNAHLLGIHLNLLEKIALLILPFFMRGLGDLEETVSKDHRLAHWLFKKMAADMWKMDRGGQREVFQIPQHLARSWGLREA